MTNKDLTHLYVVLDRSGSMAQCKEDMEGGFNTFIEEQRQLPGTCKVSLVQFDDEYEEVYWGKPIKDVPKLNLVPRNLTALLDALGRTINRIGDELAALPEDQRPGAVIVDVITDGMENASKEFSYAQVRDLIKRQTEQYNWLFVYLGANQDAIQVGASMGFNQGQTMTYDTAKAGATFSSLSRSTSAYRGSTAANKSFADAVQDATFTEEERDEVK